MVMFVCLWVFFCSVLGSLKSQKGQQFLWVSIAIAAVQGFHKTCAFVVGVVRKVGLKYRVFVRL